jgi:hypothetical protein
VLKYLARYTHRVAISNRRILSFDNDSVTFTWKDYASGNRRRIMTLHPHEFLRRFLLHVLPSGFTRIRYYGFLANRNRAENVLRARRLIEEHRADANNAIETSFVEPTLPLHSATDNDDIELCPECKKGRLILILRVDYPGRHQTWCFDSS